MAGRMARSYGKIGKSSNFGKALVRSADKTFHRATGLHYSHIYSVKRANRATPSFYPSDYNPPHSLGLFPRPHFKLQRYRYYFAQYPWKPIRKLHIRGKCYQIYANVQTKQTIRKRIPCKKQTFTNKPFRSNRRRSFYNRSFYPHNNSYPRGR